MPTVLDQALYNRIKKEADRVYRKPSAYKSGYIVKRYKAGGSAPSRSPDNEKEGAWGNLGSLKKMSGEGMEGIEKYSNPKVVREMADRYLGRGVPVYYSTRKDKKYMVVSPSGKPIHFGQMGFEDFTRHKNEQRRASFRLRNKAWAKADKWSPAFLSYWLLW